MANAGPPKMVPFLEEINLPLGRKLITQALFTLKGQEVCFHRNKHVFRAQVCLPTGPQPAPVLGPPFKEGLLPSCGESSQQTACSCGLLQDPSPHPKVVPFLGQPALWTEGDGGIKAFPAQCKTIPTSQALTTALHPLLNLASTLFLTNAH